MCQAAAVQPRYWQDVPSPCDRDPLLAASAFPVTVTQIETETATP